MEFAAPTTPVKWFWSTGNAFGVVNLAPKANETEARLQILGGQIRIASISLRDFGQAKLPGTNQYTEGAAVTCVVPKDVSR
jgi:hypothetical protein